VNGFVPILGDPLPPWLDERIEGFGGGAFDNFCLIAAAITELGSLGLGAGEAGGGLSRGGSAGSWLTEGAGGATLAPKFVRGLLKVDGLAGGGAN
jgi:hypothetical protein